MTMTRTDFEKGVIADMYEYYLESEDKLYKSYQPIYPKICEVKDVEEIKGPYAQGTTVVMDSNYQFREENQPIPFEQAIEGYVWHAKIKSIDKGVAISMEANRDLRHRVKDFLRDWIVNKGLAHQLEIAKERVIADLFNYGGYTAGHSIFNQNIPGVLATSYGNLCYDGKPFFALSGNNRAAKSGTTYYNGLALSLTYDNLVTAHKLLTSTNAKQENDEPFDNSQDKVLVVPTALSIEAKTIINSTLVPNTANNATNVLKGEYEVVENPYLTTATAWAIGRKSLGIKLWISKKPVLDFWRVPETRQLRASAHIDIAVAVTNWRGWVGSNFPTSA